MTTITIRDIGPHTNLEIPVSPGVNVLRGRNEAGKTIAIRCVAALGGGDAKNLPVRDGSAVGVVSGFGTTISVGMRTQRAGQLVDAEPVNDRVDLAALVDPRIKDAAAANKHRVRALLTLTKTKLTYEDFRAILPEDRRGEIDAEFDADDPVDLAGSIKREMEKRARRYQEDADEAASQAKLRLAALEGIECDDETPPDDTALRRAYQSAVERKSKLESEANAARLAEHNYRAAKEKMATLPKLPDLAKIAEERESRQAAVDAADVAVESRKKECASLEEQLKAARRSFTAAVEEKVVSLRALADMADMEAAAKSQHESVAKLSAMVAAAPAPGPTLDELDEATDAVRLAENAVAKAAEIRRALQRRDDAKEYLAKQRDSYAVSQIYRHAAAATDQVLTNAVRSPYFSIAGGELHAKDNKGVVRHYSDLSEGARYKLAIKAVSEAVGGGRFYFLALDQNAWDGLNSQGRGEVAAEAKRHNVAIVTGEVSDGELQVYHYGDGRENS